MMEVHIVESNLVEGHIIVGTILWTYHCYLFVIRLNNFVTIWSDSSSSRPFSTGTNLRFLGLIVHKRKA